ncbi:MAG: ABC transporter substrate-binding protein [Oscillospiraceae bacterium]|nr:ABC transporter substrate-binding protein [Oscillospiraceae bacterium]
MKKIIAVILSAALLCLSLSACGKSEAEPMKKLVLSEVTHSIFYAPQYVAINEGYFAEEGLEIELVNAGGADKVMTSVLTGAADIGFAGAEACIYVYLQGKEDYPKVFAQLTKCDGSFLVGREKAENFDWASLKGSTILPGRKGGMPYMTLLYALNKNGLSVGKDVFFNDTIQFNAMTGAFLSGEGDYVTVFEPSATDIEMQGKGYILASVGEAGGEVPYTAYFAQQNYDAVTLQKFTDAIAKGQKFVAEKSAAEIAQAIAPSFPETDIAVIETVVQRYKDIGAFSETPVMGEDAFERITDIVRNAGEIGAEDVVPFEAIIDNSYAENAVK